LFYSATWFYQFIQESSEHQAVAVKENHHHRVAVLPPVAIGLLLQGQERRGSFGIILHMEAGVAEYIAELYLQS